MKSMIEGKENFKVENEYDFDKVIHILRAIYDNIESGYGEISKDND